MSLDIATGRVVEMAKENGGTIGSSVKFVFQEGVILLDDTVTPTKVSNDDTTAQCTIKMELKDFVKLLDGDLDPMSAFMGGMMKIEGDMTIAMKLTSLF
ncbi:MULTISPECIES: SCP2 sterol-binding domain-containing protein [unclassified Imperialibacter]|uniref:SCP2 sterol-binding domain-containing protein n=1 Tax=unclassified Imperialibacter TaxID=2629706 RepID=UPI00125805AB|nr:MULTISPECIES: SCP2 sterol-binding domain-containing protein [unclassified Imperialibacter]CAD5292772.1 Sterol-binding protein [Imperialibacter sp. 89]CAD5293825.1 Sterol-binding protein [Imperialibacter sp. 75]VVT28659.1 Sterol-binding protein [Imperialibacter sp. EC-SDR9]